MKPLVIDTNVALDLCVFDDPAIEPLRQAVSEGQWACLATPAMREELQRVLAYPLVARRLAADARSADAALAVWDAAVRIVAPAPKAPYTCKDADDQIFIDLAAEHQARFDQQRQGGAVHGQAIGALRRRGLTALARDSSLSAVQRKAVAVAAAPIGAKNTVLVFYFAEQSTRSHLR